MLVAVVRFATIRDYDAGTHVAAVQVTGYPASKLQGVPVAANIDGALCTDGALCVVVLNDGYNPADACIVGIYA
jgi:hypothetical protein